eukprot:scaffold228098_cov36-Tisochrysis_lutea.AAC.2
MTPFLEAADSAALRTLQALHRAGADIHATDEHGDGALEIARWGHDVERVRDWLHTIGLKTAPTHVEGREEGVHDSHENPKYHD